MCNKICSYSIILFTLLLILVFEIKIELELIESNSSWYDDLKFDFFQQYKLYKATKKKKYTLK